MFVTRYWRFEISKSVCKQFISVEKLLESVQVHVAADEVLVSRDYKIC